MVVRIGKSPGWEIKMRKTGKKKNPRAHDLFFSLGTSTPGSYTVTAPPTAIILRAMKNLVLLMDIQQAP